MAEKHQEDVEQITAGVEDLRLPIAVLSWNINGPGNADARRRMIGSVVRHIDPDVMLLQETKTSTIGLFKDFPTYTCEKAEDEEEAQVLFKSTAFEKVSPSKVNLDKILEEMFSETPLRSGQVPESRVIKKRICVVHLRHKRTKREIIFVSYHNIRKGGGKGAVIKKASEFCQIIAKIRESNECRVIAGVDFNCYDFDRAPVKVPDYDATPRRKTKSKVDFFILDRSAPVEFTVEAFNLFPQGEKEPFYEECKRLLAYHKQGEYDEALDHDPLVLSWSSSWVRLDCKIL